MMRHRAVAVVTACLLALLTLSPMPARSDSWAPARVAPYASASGSYRVTVYPREVANGLAYFEDKVEGREPAGQKPGGRAKARAVLERADGAAWKPVWDRPLVNEVAPVTAAVTDDGAFVVTFDNWHQVGRGENVVVIYGAKGDLVRSLSLEDILPETYIAALPRSVSSTSWKGGFHFAGDDLILQVIVPGSDTANRSKVLVDVAVDLATGSVKPKTSAAWQVALEAATRRNVELAEADAARRKYLSEPLLAPTTTDEWPWHRYLVEAYFRLTPRDGSSYPAVKILRSLDHPKYEKSVGWRREVLTEDGHLGDTLMIGSPAEANLVLLLSDLGPRIPPGRFAGKRVYVVVRPAAWPAIQAAFRGSGATLLQLDPSKPLPQRPDRMPK